ncbi:MAG: carbohydrate kinase family protein [Lachnospiraceae bacterium]|nr:carbohydrate kinase family protein [Lachnospiraceae bacterium]
MSYEVYLHGQILGTHSFWLKGEFVQPDEYAEIRKKYFLPGGETGTAATVLASLGAHVKMDGTHIGTQVAPLLKEFYKDKTVDMSSIYFDPEYEGLMDYVVIAGLVRSPMGFFQTLYESGEKRWNMPKEEDIAGCKVAGIDPYFQEETQAAAELCVKHKKPYVTIDSRHDSYLHQNCAVNVVSKECTHRYQEEGYSREEIFQKLVETTEGLVVITSGEKDMLYGRKGQPMKRMKPFSVEVKSTLGAGDTFKAGCIYGLLKGLTDEELVQFASACSAIAISRFPLPLNPPTLEEVNSLLEKGKL